MNGEIMLAAAVGGLIPFLLKLLHWAVDKSVKAKFALPARWGVLLLGVGLHVILALIAAWLLAPQDKLAAAAYGYGAPDLLLRVFGSILEKTSPTKGVLLSPPQAFALWLR